MASTTSIYKPYTLKDVFGQQVVKAIMSDLLKADKFPSFVTFYGPSGTGKSTLAEISAFTLTCQSPVGDSACFKCEVCKENLVALRTGKASSHIQKLNMGLLSKKDDIAEIVKSIFILQPSSEGRYVYILEEFHLLPSTLQGGFLEELERIPENVHVLISTTHFYNIIAQIRNRSENWGLTSVRVEDCQQLIEKVCLEADKPLPNKDLQNMIIKRSQNCPREIVKTLTTLFSVENLTPDMIEEYLGFVHYDTYVDLLNACKLDMSIYLATIRMINIPPERIIRNIKDFFMDVMLLLYGSVNNGFSKPNRDALKKIFEDFSEKDFLDFMEFVGGLKASDGMYELIRLKRRLSNQTKQDVLAVSSSVAMRTTLQSEQKLEEEEESKDSAKPITPSRLQEMLKTSKFFKAGD